MKKVYSLLLLIPLVAGCSEDERVIEPPPPTFDLPESPAEVMAEFLTAYETMDLGLFRMLLDPDFETVLQQETIDQFPDVGPTLDWDEEMRIAERMFSGMNLVDPGGAFLPGVAGISFDLFIPRAEWATSPPTDPIPNTLFAPYDVSVQIFRGPEYSQMRAQGQIRFYVTSRDSLHEGEQRSYYLMRGQVDLTGSIKGGSESGTWGEAKALYR